VSAKRILVLNPNSNVSVTLGIVESLSNHYVNPDIDVQCETLAEGPFGIESDEDIASVVPLIKAKIEAASEFDAFVIACYSDPGLAACRELSEKPVFGIQQSALETAISYGGRFGVLALSDESIERHVIYIRQLGYEQQLAGELPLHVTVDEAVNDGETMRNAGVVILGCAGMAAHRKDAEQILGVPVIEPTQAAVSVAAVECRMSNKRNIEYRTGNGEFRSRSHS
jgi:Asp/Glu/hydantoin racemase